MHKEITMIKNIFVASLVLLYSTAALAEVGFQFNMIAQMPEDPDVQGMRIVLLHGKNENVGGLDLGLASFSESTNQSGFTFNMGISHITGTSAGCACALINIHEGEDSGFNGAFVNIVKNIENGVNVGFLNMTEENSSIDIGGLSMSKKSKTQVGFVNFTQEIESWQFGFLNFAENGIFPMFPFVNYPKK